MGQKLYQKFRQENNIAKDVALVVFATNRQRRFEHRYRRMQAQLTFTGGPRRSIVNSWRLLTTHNVWFR
jgi:hypothetical protein